MDDGVMREDGMSVRDLESDQRVGEEIQNRDKVKVEETMLWKQRGVEDLDANQGWHADLKVKNEVV